VSTIRFGPFLPILGDLLLITSGHPDASTKSEFKKSKFAPKLSELCSSVQKLFPKIVEGLAYNWT